MTEPIDVTPTGVTADETNATDPSSSTASGTASGGSWAALVPAILIVVLLAATAVGAVALQRRDSDATYAAPQIGWMNQGCTEWAASAGMADGTASQWCASMASWMNDRMGPMATGQGQMGQGQMGQGQMGQSPMPGQGQMLGQGPMGRGQMGQMGQGQMTGSMMWQSPETMQATCQQWASSGSAPEATDATARCAQMVSWMTQHMGDWGGWMANGPMMVPSTTR